MVTLDSPKVYDVSPKVMRSSFVSSSSLTTRRTRFLGDFLIGEMKVSVIGPGKYDGGGVLGTCACVATNCDLVSAKLA